MKKMDEINDIDELIIDYITGRLTPDKFNYLNSWIAESKDNLLYFRKLQEIWYAAAPEDDNVFDKELAYSRFLYRVKEASQSTTVIPQNRNRFLFSKKIIQIAASVVIIIALGVLSFLLFHSSTNPKDEFYSITVPYGSKSKVTLSDSTRVWLNSGTTIEYSYIVKDKIRKLVINGEAYFEVAKMEGVPFVVETNKLEVSVLGTKFNVTAYHEDDQINITLLEGSIALRMGNDRDKEVLLVPNKSAIFDKSSGQLEIKDVDGALSTQWSEGIIIFDNEKLIQIAHRLEREFNVKIDLTNEMLGESRFYGVFNKNQSIKEIFDIITLNNKLHYQMNGDTIKVSTVEGYN